MVPCLLVGFVNLRGDVTLFELVSELQSHESARRVAGDSDVILILHVLHEVEILGHDLGISLETFVVDDRVYSFTQGLKQVIHARPDRLEIRATPCFIAREMSTLRCHNNGR